MLVRGVDGAEHVVGDVVRDEELVAAHDLVEGGSTLLVDPVAVVELAGTVDAETDQEPVIVEQLAPLVGEQRAVRLDGVVHLLAGLPVALGELDGATEEVDAHEGGLAALPGDGHLGRGLRFDDLPHVGVEQLVGHAEPVPGVERLLRQEEAVLAVEVADRARRLGENVEVRRRGQRSRRRKRRTAIPRIFLAHERHVVGRHRRVRTLPQVRPPSKRLSGRVNTGPRFPGSRRRGCDHRTRGAGPTVPPPASAGRSAPIRSARA